jgi:hypothetical protein
LKLYEFLIDNNRKTYGLWGYAGTGKTTILIEFVSYLIKNKFINSVVFVAPTNKAVNVMKNKFKYNLTEIVKSQIKDICFDIKDFDNTLALLEQNNINIKFLTIHQLLMYQPDYDSTGKIIFTKQYKSTKIHIFELIVIDESSMISLDTVESIFNEVKYLKNNLNCKIIFTGDPAQLPPVNEENSSIFMNEKNKLSLNEYIKTIQQNSENPISENILKNKHTTFINNLIDMNTTTLKKVVRSKNDNITQACYQFRRWITITSFPKLKQFQGKDGIYFYNYTDNNIIKIETNWFNKFINSVKNNISSIIITWTNKQTDDYNNIIRNTIFKNKKNIQQFEINEILILNNYYNFDLGEEHIAQKLYTSEQIKVINTKLEDVPNKIFTTISLPLETPQCIKLEGDIKMLVDSLNDQYCSYKYFKCWILDVNKIDDESVKMKLLVIHHSNIAKYNTIKLESSTAIKKFSNKLLKKYPKAQKRIEKNIIKPLWKQWNDVFINNFADINYGYSITCHKAQGSTFHDVYVDLNDILKNNRIIEAKKCAYTAVTRTSNELHILV